MSIGCKRVRSRFIHEWMQYLIRSKYHRRERVESFVQKLPVPSYGKLLKFILHVSLLHGTSQQLRQHHLRREVLLRNLPCQAAMPRIIARDALDRLDRRFR